VMSEAMLGAYYWGTYIWFVVGALVVGIPAVIQLCKLLSAKEGTGEKT
jgi:hypothetical protein